MNVLTENKHRILHSYDATIEPRQVVIEGITRMFARARAATIYLATLPPEVVEGLEEDIDLLDEVASHDAEPTADLIQALERNSSHLVEWDLCPGDADARALALDELNAVRALWQQALDRFQAERIMRVAE